MSPSLLLPSATPSESLGGLPAWVYRSEAFAEDLPLVAPVNPLPGQVPLVGQPAPRASGALYLATLAVALASTVPMALLAA